MIHPEAKRMLSLLDCELQILALHPEFSRFAAEREAVTNDLLSNNSIGFKHLQSLHSEIFRAIPHHLLDGPVTLEQAMLSLEHQVASIRACGLEALGKLARSENKAADCLSDFANSDAGLEVVFGAVRLGHIAVANLIRSGSAHAVALARRLLDSRFKDESVLHDYLAGEGLM